MADSDLTTPATLADELGVAAADPKLPRLIAVASAAVRGLLNRTQLHWQAGFVEKVPGYGTDSLVLDLTPVLSVASVVLPDGTAVTDYTKHENGVLFREAGWPFTGRLRGGLPPAADPIAGSEAPTIEVTYTGGWVTPGQAATPGWSGDPRSLPFDLEEAVLQTCVGLYLRRGQDSSIASESMGDYSVSYRNPVGAGGIVPDAVLPILRQYARPL